MTKPMQTTPPVLKLTPAVMTTMPDSQLTQESSRLNSESASKEYRTHNMEIMNSKAELNERSVQVCSEFTADQIKSLSIAMFFISKYQDALDDAHSDAEEHGMHGEKINMAGLSQSISTEIQQKEARLKITTNSFKNNGGDSKLYFIDHHPSKLSVVLKRSRNTELSELALQKEVTVLSELNHKNVVALLGYYTSTTPKDQVETLANCILLPAADCDSFQFFLYEVLCTSPSFFDEAIHYIDQILQAIQYLLSKKIVLCDLKLENVLLFKSDHRWAVCDFGFAEKMLKDPEAENYSTRINMTPYTAAPERFDCCYNKGTDIFSLGCLILNISYNTDFNECRKTYQYDDKYYTKHSGINETIRTTYPGFTEASVKIEEEEDPFELPFDPTVSTPVVDLKIRKNMERALSEMKEWNLAVHWEAAKNMCSASAFRNRQQLMNIWMPCILAMCNNDYKNRPDISDLVTFMDYLKAHLDASREAIK